MKQEKDNKSLFKFFLLILSFAIFSSFINSLIILGYKFNSSPNPAYIAFAFLFHVLSFMFHAMVPQGFDFEFPSSKLFVRTSYIYAFLVSIVWVFSGIYDNFYLEKNYSLLNDKIITSNNDEIPKTKEYLDFQKDLIKNDSSKLAYHFDNKNTLLRASPDDEYSLKSMKYMTNDYDIISRIDNIFEDKFISVYEYEEFRKFIIEKK